MANANPVNSWDMTLLAGSETAFNTFTQPTAAMALESISAALGPSVEVGAVRPKKDRPLGRGMQSGFVEGDVDPFPFSVEYSQKSRSAIDSNAVDLALMKAAGLVHTVNASTSTTLTLSATPIESSVFTSAQLIRYFGKGTALHEAEMLNGCVVKRIVWSGGDKEMNVKVEGAGVQKSHMGRIDSFTVASGIIDAYVPTASEYRRFGGVATYQCESEYITITPDPASVNLFLTTRGAYSSSAVAHSAKPLYPYMPPSITYSGSPISEATASCILGSISPMRIMSWEVDFTTGMDHLPAETSSKYRQGVKSTRYDIKVKLKMVLSADRVDLLGYARLRDTLSLTLSQGTGTGSIWSTTIPYCEVVSMSVPDTAGEIAIVDVELRCRENSTGNNAFSITLT